MQFEFNREKSESNRRKHGIRLNEATKIWEQAHVEVAAKTVDEPRWMVIGKIKDTMCACIYTTRGDAVRLISCRRASRKEVQVYDEYFKEAGEKGEDDGGGV